MNKKEKEIVALLVKMRDEYGVTGLKAEFETEGTRFEELLRLKDVVSRAGVGLTLKIGGPEDVWGILQARRIGVSGIVAPMIESAYSLGKFIDAVKKHLPEDEREDVLVGMMIETKQAYENRSAMLDLGAARGVTHVTVGRIDFAGSFGLTRKDINSPEVNAMVTAIFRDARARGFGTTLGGSIESASQPFITDLVAGDLLDRFETRKVVFSAKRGVASFDEAVHDAHRLELLWLENKARLHTEAVEEDATRIVMLKKRVNSDQ